jgi:hypothetical protein
MKHEVQWVESRVSDFTDGETDPTLYVSNRAQLEPDSGCVEFFSRFDVDNNGYYDLGCSDDSGPYLMLYLGTSSGYSPTDRLKYPIPAGGNIELADLNLDGHAELIHSGWACGRGTAPAPYRLNLHHRHRRAADHTRTRAAGPRWHLGHGC